jgi:ArsR family transcriptional regulator
MQVLEVSIENTFQALSDPTRLRVIRLLASTPEEACLCEFVDSLLESQYKLSRHLKVLRQAGLVDAEKDGRWVYHRLVTGPDHLQALYDVIEALPDPKRVFRDDLKRFKERLTHREDGRCRVGVLTEALKTEAV